MLQQHVRSVFGFLFCELPVDCPFNLTRLLKELFADNVNVNLESQGRGLTVVPALFTDFLNLEDGVGGRPEIMSVQQAYPDQLISYGDGLSETGYSIRDLYMFDLQAKSIHFDQRLRSRILK